MDNLGYNKPLYILAFDHRNTFAKHMFGGLELDALTPELQEQIREFKAIIYDGFKKSTATTIPKEDAAILLDEEFGDAVLQDAKAQGVTTILTVEKSGGTGLTFEYGDAYAEHIEKYQPTFAKILIRYNPSDTPESKKQQQEQLKIISDYCHAHGYKFLLEVLIAATESQLAEAGNSQENYDKTVRPQLTVQVMKELQDAGVEPDIWKLEGMDSREAYEMNVVQAQSNGRGDVSIVILGRGASDEKVAEWIRIGAEVEGVTGFAVGRTIFWDALAAYHEGTVSREQAVDTISSNFSRFYTVYKQAHLIEG